MFCAKIDEKSINNSVKDIVKNVWLYFFVNTVYRPSTYQHVRVMRNGVISNSFGIRNGVKQSGIFEPGYVVSVYGCFALAIEDMSWLFYWTMLCWCCGLCRCLIGTFGQCTTLCDEFVRSLLLNQNVCLFQLLPTAIQKVLHKLLLLDVSLMNL